MAEVKVCQKAINGRDSILYSNLISHPDLDADSVYEYVHSKAFISVFGDWTKYANSIVSEEDGATARTLKFLKSKLDSNNEPLLSEVQAIMNLSAQDKTIELLRTQTMQYKRSQEGFTGLSKFIDENIANNRDIDFLRFNDEEFLRNELMNQLKIQGLDLYSEDANVKSQIEDIKDVLRNKLKDWKETAEIGSQLNALNASIVSDNSITSHATSIGKLKQPKFMTESEYEKYINDFTEFINELRAKGKLLSKQSLYYEDNVNRIVTASDILLVNEEGNVEIYNVKSAVRNFNDWNNQKANTVNYQLSMTKNMLQNYGLKVDSLNVLPVTLEKDSEGMIETQFEVNQNLTNSRELIRGSKINRITNDFIPDNFIQNNSELLEGNNNIIEILKEKFNTGVFTSNRDIDLETIKRKYLYIPKDTNRKVTLNNPVSGGVFARFDRSVLDNDEDLEKAIEPYIGVLRNYEQSEINKVKVYFQALKESKMKDRPEPSFESSRLGTKNLKLAMQNYVEDGWNITSIPELEELGLIAFTKASASGETVLDIVGYQANPNRNNQHDMGTKSRLLTGIYKPDHIVKNSLAQTAVPEANQTNLIGLKASLWVLNNKELFESGVKLRKITVASKNTGPIAQDFSKYKDMLGFMNSFIADDKITSGLDFDYKYEWISAYYDYLNDMLFSAISESDKNYFNKKSNEFSNTLSLYREKSENVKAVLRQIDSELEYQRKMRVSNDARYNDKQYQLLSSARLQISKIPLTIEKDILNTGNLVEANKYLSTPDEFDNSSIKYIVKIVESGLKKINRLFVGKYKNEFRKKNEEYLSSKGFSGLTKYALGETTPYYNNLIEFTSKDGETKTFRIKDPKTLSGKDREFAKLILSNINSVRTKNMTEEEELRFLESDASRNIPIMPMSVSRKLSKVILSGGKGYKEAFKDYWKESFRIENFFNESQYKQDINEKIKMADMFAYYDRNEEAREKKLNEIGERDLETNLEFILDSYMMNAYRVDTFNTILPEIDYMRSYLRMLSSEHNVPLENINDWLDHYVENAVYNVPDVNPESPVMDKLLFSASRLTSTFSLGFSFRSGLVQAFQGFWGNITEFATRSVNKDMFGFKDYIKAGTFLFKDSIGGYDQETLIETINEQYGMVNMDSQFIEQRTRRRKGIANFQSKWMYWMNNAPEYMNRMHMFIAQMMKDGTFKAHTTVNGELVYDEMKDERFRHYLTGNTKNPKYEQQKALYEFTKAELQKEGDGVDPMTGKLTRAYSDLQIRSLKNVADSIAGAYDHENKVKLARMSLGRLVMQFKTWLRAKIVRYYRTGIVSGTRGNVVYEKLSDGTTIARWEGQYMEGILQTLNFLYQEVTSGKGNVIDKASKVGKNLNQSQKENLARLGADIAILGGMFGLYELLEDEIKKDRNSFLAWNMKVLTYSVQDLNVLNTTSNLLTQSPPLASLTFMKRSLNTMYKVATLEDNPIEILKLSGIGRTVTDFTGE